MAPLDKFGTSPIFPSLLGVERYELRNEQKAGRGTHSFFPPNPAHKSKVTLLSYADHGRYAHAHMDVT